LIARKKRDVEGSETPSTVHGGDYGGYTDVFIGGKWRKLIGDGDGLQEIIEIGIESKEIRDRRDRRW